MKVFITGGSGFVGRRIIRQLLEKKHQVRALIRGPDRLSDISEVEKVQGDTTSPDTLKDQLEGCDAVIHLVGIIREFPSRGITFKKIHTESTLHMVEMACSQGVQRFIHMSANGARPDAVSDYHKTKWAAEEIVRGAGLDWTIFRPSLIFGPEDEFINMLARMIKLSPVVPVIGNGQYRLQPVSVDNIAQAFVGALEKPETSGQSYYCCGPDVFTYDELLDNIAAALGRSSKPCKIHQPLALMKPLISAFDRFPIMPITRDQLQMLLEENICADNQWQEVFNLRLKRLEDEITGYLK